MGLGAENSAELGIGQRKYEKLKCLKGNVKGRGMGRLTCFSLDKVMRNEADISLNARGVYLLYVIRQLLFLCKYYLILMETFSKFAYECWAQNKSI